MHNNATVMSFAHAKASALGVVRAALLFTAGFLLLCNCLFILLGVSTCVYADTRTSNNTATASATPNTDNSDAALIAIPNGIPGLNGVGKQLQLPQLSQHTPNSNSANTQPNPTPAAKPPVPSSLGIQAMPELNAPIVDTTNTLTAIEKQQLAAKIMQIYHAGSAQIGVIMLSSTGSEAIFDYASRAFTQWKLGDAKRDNGLLLVVALDDRKIQILTGYGLEGVLPDILAKHVIEDNIKPFFKAGQYAQGLNAGIDKIDAYLQADPETAASAIAQAKHLENNNTQVSAFPNYLIAVVLVLLFFGSIARHIFGHFWGASSVGLLGAGIGLATGAGVVLSAFLGLATFLLVLVGVGNILAALMQGGGGGFGGGSSGGYSGGGGSFGGGGASGSW